MQQTFEYYIVDPSTWKDRKRVDNVISSTINRDLSAETLGSASINITESLGECYIRIYLVTIQNGVREKHPLGTFLVQTPSYGFDGKIRNVTMDAYTPLLELKENQPPLGYFIPKDTNILNMAYRLVRENARAPVVETTSDNKLYVNFIANSDDTWISFVNDLLSNIDYSLYLDDVGRVLFTPNQELNTLQPIWTYDDSNSSILYPDLNIEHDLYGIPNVVEVVYSNGGQFYYARAINDDPSSMVSVRNRGREITRRISDPALSSTPDQNEVQQYAERVLRELSSIEYTVSYTHGYCPVRIGDCVRLNYAKAGLQGVNAKVISQSIKCEPGCPVTEKATFTVDLWRGLNGSI